jgi:hypothetical protein
MKKAVLFFILQFFISFYSSTVFSQLEKVIVEKYYISDANDFTDISGGIVPIGSTTYRIFIDLAPGTVLKNIYGDANHPFKITSTEVFFNNILDGQTFAKDFIKNRYTENTVALDSWLTLGQTTKKQGSITNFGVLKSQDNDGSFIGGTNNDGGSELIVNGLLTNADPLCGIPLTIADGMDTMTEQPTNWIHTGILDFTTGNDSTIFGSLSPESEFIRTQFYLANSGVSGVIPDSNQVIIAQLTTKGDLYFELNLEVERIINGVPTIVKYVAKDTLLDNGEIFNAYLKYPLECGCDDPDFLEYNSVFTCYEIGSCITPVKFGCMDSTACNYDPEVNFNIEDLCCYPGNCNNRDIAVVCPELRGDSFEFLLHPNPVNGLLYLDVYSGILLPITYTIYNAFGVKIVQKTLDPALVITGEVIETSAMDNGLYHIQVEIGNIISTQLFVKN